MGQICNNCMHALNMDERTIFPCVARHMKVPWDGHCSQWKPKVQYTGMYSHITDLTKDNNADRQKGE